MLRKFTCRAGILIGAAYSALSGLPVFAQAPDSAQVEMIVRVGVGTLNNGRYKDAETAFRKLLELDPCHPKGLQGLAEIQFRQGLPVEAVRVAEPVIEKCGSRADTLQVFGDILLRSNQKPNDDRAIATYQHALELNKEPTIATGVVYFRLAELYRRKDDKEAWGKALEQAELILKDDPALLVAKGAHQDALGDREAALASYRQAVRLDPRNAQALNNLAFVMADLNMDLDQALEFAKRARTILPESADVADTIGWIYTRKRWGDVAIMVLKTVLEKDPSNAGVRKHLLAALELKQQGPAVQELQAALKEPVSLENDEKIKSLLLKVTK